MLAKLFHRKKGKQTTSELDLQSKPRHIAVVMDGNGRWAKKRGLPRVAGHRKGVESVRELTKLCIKYDIPYLTLFAFSSENWNRPKEEVSALMDLLLQGMKNEAVKFDKYKIKLRTLGDMSRFDVRIQDMAKTIVANTAEHEKLNLSVAINYGGRWDITQACQQLAQRVQKGDIVVEDIKEGLIDQFLTTKEIPDPDLVVRTSGEHRVSNFLLWQSAYSEFYFTDTLWPDFDQQAFEQALLSYDKRDRRYGLVK